MDNILNAARERMSKSMSSLHTDLSTIRTGRATPSLVENLPLMVYGGTQRLRVMELATVGTLDSQTLVITPFDASIIDEMRKGIAEGAVGLNPVVDSGVIRISIPPLSEERRQELIHSMHQKLENGRIMIRQVRHEAMDEIKKAKAAEDEASRLEKEVQNLTDEFIAEIDALGKKKEEELLQI